MPIRIRLAVLFAAGTALLIAVGGTIFVNELSGGLTNSLATGLEARATVLLASNASGHSLSSALERTNAPNGAAEFAQIVSSAGTIVDSSGPDSKRAIISRALIATMPRRGVVLQQERAGDGGDLLVYVEPIAGRHDVLVVGASLGTIDAALDGVERSLIVGGPIAVLLAAFASYLLSGAALRPVERMRRQASEISEHDKQASLDVPRTDDEIAALARTLNELLARLHGSLSRQRGFVASAGHELRTPLTNLKLELELASHPARSSSELYDAVRGATEEVDRLSRLAEGLLLLAQSDEAASLVLVKRQDVSPILEAAVKSFAARAGEQDVLLELDVPSPLEASVDDVAMRQVLENLLDNALRFAPAGSLVCISACAAPNRGRGVDQRSLLIEVSDAGPGFTAEFLPRAFERFSRPDDGRDRRGGGAGLGLAIVKALVEVHGGNVEVTNRVSGGALVRIRIPMTTPEPLANGQT